MRAPFEIISIVSFSTITLAVYIRYRSVKSTLHAEDIYGKLCKYPGPAIMQILLTTSSTQIIPTRFFRSENFLWSLIAMSLLNIKRGRILADYVSEA